MIVEVKDPIAVLSGMQESLLISYRYDAQGREFVMVLDYYRGRAWGAGRAFLRLRFLGVSSFHRLKGEDAELHRFTDSYSTWDTRFPIELEDINIMQDQVLGIRLHFDHSFGSISFVCERLTAEARNTRAVQTGADEWYYYDFSDGAPVDFHDPFA